MEKQLRFLIAFLMVLGLAAAVNAGQYSPAWQNYLAAHSQDHMVGAIITMADQVDLRALQDHLYAIHADRQLWHQTVMTALQDKATSTQADILAQLADLQAQGQVSHYQGLWVGNVVVINATPAALAQIVNRSDVMQVSPDYPIQGIAPVDQSPSNQQTIASVENGLRAIGADSCWNLLGINGDGRLVSHLDTGVDGNHVALAARWRGVADSRYIGHADWAWYDPVTNTDFPFDSAQHGTHTMGTMCGLGVATGDTVGVAFGAQWISAGVIDRVSIQQTVQDALTAFQWIADPDGDANTVFDVPDVNSDSWGLMPAFGYPMCDETFWVVLDGCEAAGVVVNFAAGNEGPTSESLRSPADRASTDTKSFSVGAVDGNQYPDDPIASFSSRGPSHCTPDGSETIKPEVSAPGVNVRSCMPGNGYQLMSGTSMATPHVSGAVALIRQANPNLSSEQVHTILMETATDKGAPGEDNDYGAGVINCYQAVLRAMAYLQGWGTLGGVITDQGSGNPIAGAHVTILNRAVQLSATSRPDGHYFLFCPADTSWHIRVEATDHLPVFDNITVTENDTLVRNYALEGKVPVTLKASFGNPQNCDYRSFYFKGSWDADGFWNAGWTAPAIEVKDDGVAPDAVAGDGIFTGRVLLARDMVNTYNWAIYSENYNGEFSRLQDGTSFVIHDLTPPTVPTLVVNPSGSYHNWQITAVGDNGLNLDLAQGIDGRPTKWGAAESLSAGITYTLKFKVMHSEVAWYGVGGVGGGNITFNCTSTGAYDFIFNDRDDSYIIQLSGTDGPMTYLHAVSGLDHHIPVSWLPPGTVESQELSFDDGTLANAYYYYAYDAIMANMFTPASYPTLVDSVLIHVLTDGDQYWPWPDATHDPIGVSIFLDDGNGNPEADPAFYGEVTGAPGEWIRLDIPEVDVVSGNFWVGMNNLAGGGDEGLGLDAATDYQGNKWSRFNGVWGLESSYDGDQMIRAKVFGGSRSQWLSVDSKPIGNIAISVPEHHNTNLVASTSKKEGGSFGRMAYHPDTRNLPIISDVAVLAGYNLYRGTAPGPFDGHLKVNDVLIQTTNYDDHGGQQGPIANGILYYYQGSAVYDIGGGNFVEVGPSNQDSAMAVNHPPATPTNLTTSVNDRDVRLTWRFVDDIGDFSHFSVERKLMPLGTWTEVGTPTDTTFLNTIGPGEDGTYGYRVFAVDNGTPPLSSLQSNTAYALVGHLPPGGLVAVSGQEFRVPLRWMLPGSWRAQSDDGQNNHSIAGRKANVLPMLPQPLDLSQKGETGPLNPPVILGRGGPDTFGYTWVDSDEPDGPTFEWRDITDRGAQIPIANDDQTLGPFDVGFDFSFYGNTFNQFYVCSNGWLSFTDGNSVYYNNQSLPNTANTPMNLVAPFWDDFYPPDGGQYWFYSDGSECVISFINMMRLSGGGPFTFQIVLRSSGTILLEYDNQDTPVNECTIGIQNSDGGDGLQVAYNADYLHSQMAIRLQSSPEGFSPAYFKLYRSFTSPVPIDPGHLLNGHIAGTEVSYVDTAGVQNGTPYYYKMTAVWPDSVESPPSNEATGTAANHPPEPPINLSANVLNRDINCTWSFTNLMHDRDHFNIYKRVVPGGTFTLAGSSTDTSGTIVIPSGQDGVYEIAITAVDNGTPPLESGYSHTVFVSVGHLPPVRLVARSNFDQAIPLNWMLPGSNGIASQGHGLINPTSAHGIANSVPMLTSVSKKPTQVEIAKEKGAREPLNPPQLLGRGGPDEFGYSWIDSDEPDGPIYNWIDITDRGAQIPITLDDQNLGPFDIGFDFSFYGNTFNQFYICSNGWVSFTDGTNDYYFNYALPEGTSAPMNLLAPFWDDLNPTLGGQYWFYSDGNQCVISFIDVPHYLNGGPYTFQIILSLGGLITYQYNSMNDPMNECTVGIQNGDASIALQMVYNADYVHDGLAVKIATQPDLTPPVHYKLYRSQTSPVQVDPSHLITAAISGDRTTYTDSGTVQNGTTYYYVLTAVWPDSGESPASNEVSGRAVLGARMTLNPITIDVTGPAGQVTTANLNIANPGGLDLNWGIFAQTDQMLSVARRQHSAPIHHQAAIQDVDKSNLPADPTNPPMLLGRGGPDEFGYSWIDSDEPGGPSYNWAEITDRGQSLSMLDDDNQGPFDLTFNFPFYGNVYSSIQICSNGWISFSDAADDYYNNTALPSASLAPYDLVAPFWDDLAPNNGGEVWFYANADSAVVSWINVPHYSSGGPYTFQAVLLSNGAIFYNYQGLTDPLNSATIGIQNSDMTIGLQVAYNQDYVHNEMTTRISAGWLSASPSAGVLSSGNNVNVTVSCDASLLSSGTYTGSLVVSGSDINHQLANVTIPVTFHVTPTGISDNSSGLPKEYALSQNYPNPFNPTTQIEFALPTKSLVSLEIYNVLGQKVRTLVDGVMVAGYKSVTWDGTDQSGQAVTSGTYFYKLTTVDKVITKKMTMLK